LFRTNPSPKSFGLRHMQSEHPTIYRVLRVLVWGIVGILLSMIALLALVIVGPFFMRTLLESASLSGSLGQASRSLIVGLGSLGSAIFGLIFALVVVLILMGIGLAILERTPTSHFKARDEALEALKLRYAKGEITKEQFLEMKRTLNAGA
jgi:putative membrane protein